MNRRITVRVTPNASHPRCEEHDDMYHIRVSAPPEKGRATDAARRMLAKAIGIAPSRISLVMGSTSRVKIFEVLP